MKALRRRLHQPEAYLREVLEGIADLPKSGKFAMNWVLKPDYADSNHITTEHDGLAPGPMAVEGAEDEEMLDDDDDEEGEEFEDVPVAP